MIYSPLDLGVDLGALYQVLQPIDSSLCIPFLLWDSQKKSRAAALGTEGAASLPSHWIAGAGLVAWCSWTRCWKIRLDQEELPMGSLERSLVSWRRHWRERSRSIMKGYRAIDFFLDWSFPKGHHEVHQDDMLGIHNGTADSFVLSVLILVCHCACVQRECPNILTCTVERMVPETVSLPCFPTIILVFHLQVTISWRGNPQFALTRPRLDKITPNTMDHTCEFSCVFVLSQPVFGQLGPRKGWSVCFADSSTHPGKKLLPGKDKNICSFCI